MPHAQNAISRNRANHRRIQAPLLEHIEHFLFTALLGHQQHAFLRFRQHNFVSRHARLALRNVHQVHFHAGAGAAAHLRSGASQSGGAHVLDTFNRSGLHRFKACLKQQLLHERIAHLHVGPMLFRFFGEFIRRHGRAMDAVFARLCANVNHRVAHAFSASQKHFVGLDHA